jgi:hypothetical protein
MINMKVFISHNNQVRRCLDLLINYILHLSVILQPVARDSIYCASIVASGTPDHLCPGTP